MEVLDSILKAIGSFYQNGKNINDIIGLVSW